VYRDEVLRKIFNSVQMKKVRNLEYCMTKKFVTHIGQLMRMYPKVSGLNHNEINNNNNNNNNKHSLRSNTKGYGGKTH
jgi:hypothetical protein